MSREDKSELRLLLFKIAVIGTFTIICWNAIGVSQGDGAKALLRKPAATQTAIVTVPSLPPLPPKISSSFAVVLPPAKPVTNYPPAWRGLLPGYTYDLMQSTNMGRTWTLVCTNPPSISYVTNNSRRSGLVLYRLRGRK